MAVVDLFNSRIGRNTGGALPRAKQREGREWIFNMVETAGHDNPAPTAAASKASIGYSVLIYALFAALWIFGSDLLLEWLVDEKHTLTLVSLYKGWAFVAVTSLLLYGLMRRQAHQRPRAAELPPLPADAMIVVPVRNMVLFPEIVLPLTVGRPLSVAAIQQAVREAERKNKK